MSLLTEPWKVSKERNGRENLTLEVGCWFKGKWLFIGCFTKVWWLRPSILFKKKKNLDIQLTRVFSTVASCYDHWAVNFTIFYTFFFLFGFLLLNTLFLPVVLWLVFLHLGKRVRKMGCWLFVSVFHCCMLLIVFNFPLFLYASFY